MYEIHITTKTIPVKDFCNALYYAGGIKPAVLMLSSGEVHQMTSERVEDNAFLEANRMVSALMDQGLEILRVKIESAPTGQPCKYYEAHFDGLIPGLAYAVNIIKETPILSSTLRSRDSLTNFSARAFKLARENKLPRPDIEEIIFDNNEKLDSLWLA